MTVTVVEIIVEVLAILAIATKETKQGRLSGSIHSNLSSLVDGPLEKRLRRLVGNNDVENALKRLDRLTQEETRMAAAEALILTHSINDKTTVLIDGMQIR